MSAQTRYRTLVHNISRVYSSPDAGRTELLQAGIDEIVGVMAPATAPQWRTVKADTERLLRVWSAKEGDSDVAHVVADQIMGLLEELSFAPAVDRIMHVNPYPSLVVEEFTPVSRMPAHAPAPAPAPAPVVIVTKAEEEPAAEEDIASVPAEDESEAEDEDSDIASVPAEDESEAEGEDSDNASAPASVVAAVVLPAKEAEVVESEEVEVEEAEAEEEVVEPADEEAEEEEEVGMEVEQVMIRGRTYWKDTNTNKLYAVVRGDDGEDDVGDEVGMLENGKPKFLSK